MRTLWFPSSTTADLLSEDQKKDMHSRCREADKHTPEGRQTGTDVSGEGHRQTQSSLEHRSRFQTLSWASLIKFRMTVLEFNHCRGLECIEIHIIVWQTDNYLYRCRKLSSDQHHCCGTKCMEYCSTQFGTWRGSVIETAGGGRLASQG